MGEKMDSEREAFEKWYVENAFDYEANPLGSRDCGLQWKAWQAAHLTQPAQAVDVGAIEAVIRELCKWPKDETFYDHRATRLACAEKLRALGNANGKEG